MVAVSQILKSMSGIIIKAFGVPRSYAYAVSRSSGFTAIPRNTRMAGDASALMAQELVKKL